MRNKAEKKSRYSDKELNEFEVLIDKKIEETREQMNFYVSMLAESANTADNKIRGLDDGTGTAENERLSNMASRLNRHIHHLENAKARIKNKVYGVCRVTGELISKERLRAVPHATLSIKAKQTE